MSRRGGARRVIGIDPGLRRAGWGVIEVDGPRLRHVANGVVASGEGDLPARLLAIHDGLAAAIARHAPDEGAVELTFVNRDGAGSLKLGQARGVAVLALARAGLPVGEYMPNLVKKTVVGTGHAQKAQVGHMVRLQLPGCEPGGEDAADALAVAICHAMHARGPAAAA